MAASSPSETADGRSPSERRAPIEFIDLKAQQARIRAAHRRARSRACSTTAQYIMGPEVGELERQLAAFAGASARDQLRAAAPTRC